MNTKIDLSFERDDILFLDFEGIDDCLEIAKRRIATAQKSLNAKKLKEAQHDVAVATNLLADANDVIVQSIR